jgi:DNA-binding NarL/FixJ family response regulator
MDQPKPHRHETQPRSRLLIADDDPSVRSMLTLLLERDFELVGVAADAREAIELSATSLPDAALIDVEMPEGGGPAAVRGIRGISPGTAMVALSSDESQAGVLEMIEAGATSYRRKGGPPELLIETLHRSIAAHSWLAVESRGA